MSWPTSERRCRSSNSCRCACAISTCHQAAGTRRWRRSEGTCTGSGGLHTPDGRARTPDRRLRTPQQDRRIAPVEAGAVALLRGLRGLRWIAQSTNCSNVERWPSAAAHQDVWHRESAPNAAGSRARLLREYRAGTPRGRQPREGVESSRGGRSVTPSAINAAFTLPSAVPCVEAHRTTWKPWSRGNPMVLRSRRRFEYHGAPP